MAFPWRKMKISQIVNDHLHNSRKRRDGSILVVETGFPTSLIDLFMKNREKLKKSSKKRRNSSSICTDLEQIPSVPSEVNEILDMGLSNETQITRSVIEEDEGKSITELLILLMIFLMAFFVLGTNRTTMGISISTFLLLLLDFIATHLMDNQNSGILMQEKNSSCFTETVKTSEIQMNEIEEEPESSSPQEIEQHKVKKQSKRAKVKAKLKKFFTKRFKKLIKGKLETITESDNEVSSSPIVNELCTVASLEDEEVEGNKKEAQKSETWRFFLCSFFVLVGLFGGRTFSILITLVVFFTMNFVEKYWGY